MERSCRRSAELRQKRSLHLSKNQNVRCAVLQSAYKLTASRTFTALAFNTTLSVMVANLELRHGIGGYEFW